MLCVLPSGSLISTKYYVFRYISGSTRNIYTTYIYVRACAYARARAREAVRVLETPNRRFCLLFWPFFDVSAGKLVNYPENVLVDQLPMNVVLRRLFAYIEAQKWAICPQFRDPWISEG